MEQKILTGVVLDEQAELSISDLCRACSSSAEWVIELVEEGALEPLDRRQTLWRFSASSLPRARKAMRLQRDLGLNLAGVALALDLLDKIEGLESRLQFLEMIDDG